MTDVVQEKVQNTKQLFTGEKNVAQKNSIEPQGNTGASKLNKRSPMIESSNKSKGRPEIGAAAIMTHKTMAGNAAAGQSSGTFVLETSNNLSKPLKEMSTKEKSFMSVFEQNFARISTTDEMHETSTPSLKPKRTSGSPDTPFHRRFMNDSMRNSKSASSLYLFKKEPKFTVINFNTIEHITVKNLALSKSMPTFQNELDMLLEHCTPFKDLKPLRRCLVWHKNKVARAEILSINGRNVQVLWIDEGGMETVSADE